MRSQSVKNINNIFILIMMLIIILDPANKIFKLKEIMMIISFIPAIILLKKNGSIKKIYIVLILLYFLIPNFYAGSLRLTTNNEFSIIFYRSYLLGGFFSVFLLNLNYINKEKLIKYLTNILFIYSIIYSFLIINFNFNIFNINEYIYNYSLEKENLMVGFYLLKNYRIYTIFYKTCPILVLYYSYLLYYKNKRSILILFILIMSGTAANLLSAILITSFYILSKILKKWNLINRLILFSILSISGILLMKNVLFSSQDIGNSIKYGHLTSYIKFWTKNINEFLLGSGLGSGIYTYGRNAIEYNTELTYFEIIRIYGLILGIIMIALLIYPLLKLIKNKRMEWLFISYLSYLFIGGTNPLILGSTGALVLMVVYRLIN